MCSKALINSHFTLYTVKREEQFIRNVNSAIFKKSVLSILNNNVLSNT